MQVRSLWLSTQQKISTRKADECCRAGGPVRVQQMGARAGVRISSRAAQGAVRANSRGELSKCAANPGAHPRHGSRLAVAVGRPFAWRCTRLLRHCRRQLTHPDVEIVPKQTERI